MEVDRIRFIFTIYHKKPKRNLVDSVPAEVVRFVLARGGMVFQKSGVDLSFGVEFTTLISNGFRPLKVLLL